MVLTPFQRGAYIRCLVKRGLIDKSKAKELDDTKILEMSEPFRKKPLENPIQSSQKTESDSEVEQIAEKPAKIGKPKKPVAPKPQKITEKKQETLSIEDLRELIRDEIETAINEIDFEKFIQSKEKSSGGYSGMIYMLLFQALVKIAPPLLETAINTAKNHPAFKSNPSNPTSSGGISNTLHTPLSSFPHTLVSASLPPGFAI